jgi:hypothetical protein
MPAWFALAELPWGTILKQAAALLKQANQLRTSSRPPSATPSASSDIDVLRQKIVELEQQQREDAELMQQLANQIAAVAVAAQATAVNVRRALLLAIAGVVLAIAAMLLAWIR